MSYILQLSKEHLPLAQAEAELLLGIKGKREGNLLFLKKISPLAERLAFTKEIFKILFTCPSSSLKKGLSTFNWQKIYKKSFSVRINGKGFNEPELASIIYKKLKDPKVSLENPKTPVHIFLGKKAYCCLRLKHLKQDYDSRKAHNRPAHHPTSLHPKLSRAMVNLTGIKKGTIIDPFCGSGGILLEAGLMHLKTVGYDIDHKVLQKASINLKGYKIKDFKLKVKDALKMKAKISYLATDLPYGLNTEEKNPEKLAKDFLSLFEKLLTRRAVIMLPRFKGKNPRYGSFFRKLRIIRKFEWYIHDSLSRLIYVVEPNT